MKERAHMRVFQKKNFKKDNSKNGCIFKIAWIVLLCLVSALLSRYILIGINDMLAVGKPVRSVMMEVKEGDSLGSIASRLKEQGIISEKMFFRLYARFTNHNKKFLPGVYELQTNMDYQSIINHLQNKANVKNVVEITFTEGMNILEYAELLEKEHVCLKDDFLKCCNSDEVREKNAFLKSITNLSDRLYHLEGYLFPDTYNFYKGEPPEKVINTLLLNYHKKISEKNDLQNYKEKVSVSEIVDKKALEADKVLTIASLIQSEAANTQDMYKVSSVIHNRLKTLNSGGKSKFGEFGFGYLQLDATVYYPYKSKQAKSKKSGNVSAPKYDTYKVTGLPPGPICNPGMDAILAAINPEETDYYYYCHDGFGNAYYAKTKSEHSQNLKKAGLK